VATTVGALFENNRCTLGCKTRPDPKSPISDDRARNAPLFREGRWRGSRPKPRTSSGACAGASGPARDSPILRNDAPDGSGESEREKFSDAECLDVEFNVTQ